jgi:hypothetical protein
MTDLVKRMQEWLAAQPDPRGRTFHGLHPETLIADEIERLREELRQYNEYAHRRDINLDAAVEIEWLRDALQSLLDVQNGPPLLGRYAEEWQAAVDQARAALGEGNPVDVENKWDNE